MSHHTSSKAYLQLQKRLDLFPHGAPPSKTLFKILSMLFTEREAHLVSELPLRHFTAQTAASIWHTTEAEARCELETLASRAILLDITNDQGQQYFLLPPPMAGFFEFSLMRVRGDLDQHLLGQLFFEYLNVEEDFIKDLFLGSETRFGRVFVQERVLTNAQAIHVLDWERTSATIREARHIAVGTCYCRHKMQHVGHSCAAPMEVCLTFGGAAASLAKHGHARAIDAREALDLVTLAQEHGLVQCGENVRHGVTFLCNCCGCCCEGLVAARKFGSLTPIHTTAFLAEVDAEKCIQCGKCQKACPVGALEVSQRTHEPKPAKLHEELCLGCGVCVRSCPKGALALRERTERIITPATSAHRIVLMAIERGKLQNLIFDKQALVSHRAMASILSAILALPPVKRALASLQMRSLYVDALLARRT